MPRERNEAWEQHLAMDIMLDAYAEEEQVMSWYVYLEENVNIRRQKRDLAVPLVQAEGIDVDEDTQEGILDWHYWVEQDYQF